MKLPVYLLLLTAVWACTTCRKSPDEAQWIHLFNGKDLSGWDIKISGHPLNENYKNIFSVTDGILKVSYDNLDSFRGEFGHLYSKQPYSHYKLVIEYRFTGNQCAGGPEWGIRNSGVMFHSQPAEKVGFSQDFPVSVEAQFLGGLGKGERTTMNVCTPGTHIDFNGKPVEDHCTNSSSKTYDGDQWVSVEIIVLGDSIIHHIIGGDTVMTYTRLRLDGEMTTEGYSDEIALKKGHIALQAESHNVEFRKVELLDLSGASSGNPLPSKKIF